MPQFQAESRIWNSQLCRYPEASPPMLPTRASPSLYGSAGIKTPSSPRLKDILEQQAVLSNNTQYSPSSSTLLSKMILPFSLLALGSVVAAVNFDWNCQNSLGPCNNACFRVNCRGSPLPLTYDSNTANRDPRRTRSGCNKTPCTNTGYKKYGNSCDEFPFASVTQGGTGATLRCVDSTENSSMYTTSPKTSPSH